MIDFLNRIKDLSVPYAEGWMHVQGPGGNTSVKVNDLMAIKASGYEFKNVVEGQGVVLTDFKAIADKLALNYNDNALEATLPIVVESFPKGLRPSMEFEFHSILDNYVLHTHSVVVNIVSCCAGAEGLFKKIFHDIEFAFIDYFMPGHPLSAAIFAQKDAGYIAPIVFLKNHGIIVHANSISEVIDYYQLVETRILNFFGITLNDINALDNHSDVLKIDDDHFTIHLNLPKINVLNISTKILVPDQSIFFKNKVSQEKPIAPIFISPNDDVLIQGSHKFVNSALSMLKMVYFIAKSHQELNLESEFIVENELAKLHGLSSENYRLSIL